MSERRRDDWVPIGLALVAFVTLLVTHFVAYFDGYRQGQIDAINGQIEFHLVEQPDQTLVWERIDQ